MKKYSRIILMAFLALSFSVCGGISLILFCLLITGRLSQTDAVDMFGRFIAFSCICGIGYKLFINELRK